MQPYSLSFVGVLKACASMVAIEEGRCVHWQIIQSGFESDMFVGSSLVDMYAKSGSMEDAWGVFNKMPSRAVVTWNGEFRLFLPQDMKIWVNFFTKFPCMDL